MTVTTSSPQLSFVTNTSAPVTITRPSFYLVTDTVVANDGSIKYSMIGASANVSFTPTPYSLYPGSLPATTSVSLCMRDFRNGAAQATDALDGISGTCYAVRFFGTRLHAKTLFSHDLTLCAVQGLTSSPTLASISTPASVPLQVTDQFSGQAGFNQIAVCADVADPTSPLANCDENTVLYIGSPKLTLSVFGPQELNGPLFPSKFLLAGEQITFVWNTTTTSTNFMILMWMNMLGSAVDLLSASLVATVSSNIPFNQLSLPWTVPTNFVYDPTMQVRLRAICLFLLRTPSTYSLCACSTSLRSHRCLS